MAQGLVIRRLRVLSAVMLFALGGVTHAAGNAGDKAKDGEKPKVKPYPLDVCAVSDEKLGTMGKPVVLEYEGREVKFCCSHCEPEFKKDPKKYLKKVDEAAAAAAEKKDAEKKEGGGEAK
jgi:YHS domain-containing protein